MEEKIDPFGGDPFFLHSTLVCEDIVLTWSKRLKSGFGKSVSGTTFSGRFWELFLGNGLGDCVDTTLLLPAYGGWGFGLLAAVIKLFEVVLDSEIETANLDTLIGYTF